MDLHDERVNKAVGGLIVFAVLYMIYHIIRAILRG